MQDAPELQKTPALLTSLSLSQFQNPIAVSALQTLYTINHMMNNLHRITERQRVHPDPVGEIKNNALIMKFFIF